VGWVSSMNVEQCETGQIVEAADLCFAMVQVNIANGLISIGMKRE